MIPAPASAPVLLSFDGDVVEVAHGQRIRSGGVAVRPDRQYPTGHAIVPNGFAEHAFTFFVVAQCEAHPGLFAVPTTVALDEDRDLRVCRVPAVRGDDAGLDVDQFMVFG